MICCSVQLQDPENAIVFVVSGWLISITINLLCMIPYCDEEGLPSVGILGSNVVNPVLESDVEPTETAVDVTLVVPVVIRADDIEVLPIEVDI